MRLLVGAATDTGRVRSANEDAYAVRVSHCVFVVCDGMGGAAAGEVASQTAVETIIEQLTRGDRLPIAAPGADDEGYLPQTNRLAEAVIEANDAICRKARANEDHAGMGTTIVGAWIQQSIASVAHVGDSRAYLWRNHTLEALTTDHSLVEEEVRVGLIERDQMLASEHQNVLLRALGQEDDVNVDVTEVPMQSGDYLVLCTDGLTRTVPDADIADAIFRLRDPQAISDHLIRAANDNGGPDNITVVVVKVSGSWWQRIWSLLRRKGV